MRIFRRGPRVDPLGEGVWRRAHDRFVRAVDRVHMALDGVPRGDVRDALADVASRLAALVEVVHAVCASAQQAAPSAAHEVPGGPDGRFLDVHRALSRAATLTAQASEAMTMARVELSGPLDSVDVAAAHRYVPAAARAADAAAALVQEAARTAATSP